jgi:hypothetical protein
MRVISQIGEIDIPYEDFVFSILNSGGGNYGIVAVKNVAEPPEVFMNSLIATYSTEEKAIKAMELLKAHYGLLLFMKLTAGTAKYESFIKRFTEDDFIKATTEYFQFPQDDEIEV